MNELDTTPYEPSLERRVHIAVCKFLDLDDSDHEDDDEAKPLEDALLYFYSEGFNAALAAAESALPEKRAAKYGDGLGNSYYIRSEGFDEAIDVTRQQIRALRRGMQ